MSFEAFTMSLLTADAALVALVPQAQIHFATSPQRMSFPAVLCFPVSMTPQLTTDNGQAGVGRLDNIFLQVSCYARTYVAARQIADQVRKTLEGQLNPSNTTYICTDSRAVQEDFADCYGIVLQFSCWHAST